MKNRLGNIIAVLCIAISYSSFAQSNATPVAVQAGVGHLNKGVCTITLNEQMQTEGYFVSVTPYVGGGTLYITKQKDVVTVKSRGSNHNEAFDYVIFKNQTLETPHALVRSKVAPSK